jgi:uncharacterized membrane protein
MTQIRTEFESPMGGAYDATTRQAAQSTTALENRANGHSLAHRSLARAQRTAQGLGWFSVGLGLAELLAPRQLGRFIGVGGNRRNTLRAMGLRELAAGLGILARPRPTGWMWGRVAGDLVDLALLGLAFGSRRSNRARLPAALASVAGVTALDILVSTRLTRAERQGISAAKEQALSLTKVITVGRGPDEVYQFWRNFQNLPSFMSILQSVEVVDDLRSRWMAEGPGGKTLQWEVEITDDLPGERIAWRSLEGAPIPNQGEVTFRRAPRGRGTEVFFSLKLEPPAGIIRGTMARLLKKIPEFQVANDLRRFKQVMEVGEVVCSDASIYLGPHPARPPSDDEIE